MDQVTDMYMHYHLFFCKFRFDRNGEHRPSKKYGDQGGVRKGSETINTKKLAKNMVLDIVRSTIPNLICSKT